MLLLLGQMDEAWEPFKSSFLSEVGERLIEMYLNFFFFRGETLSWKSVCIRKALRTVKSTDVFRGFSRS